MAVPDPDARARARARRRDQAATAAARAGGVLSLAVALLGAPAVHHSPSHISSSASPRTSIVQAGDEDRR